MILRRAIPCGRAALPRAALAAVALVALSLAGTGVAASPAPAPRLGASFGYDPTSGDLVLFGGDNATSSCEASCLALLNDTWTLTVNNRIGTWTWAKKAAAPAGLTPRDFPAVASATNA